MVSSIVIVIFIIGIIVMVTKDSLAVVNPADNKMISKDLHKRDEIKIKRNDSSKYPGLNLQTETKESEIYTSSIKLPSTSYDSINEPIHKWVKQQEDEFAKEIELNKDFLKDDFRAHLNIHLDTEKITDNIYNLMFYKYEIAGGANGINTTKSFTIDLKQESILELDDIIELNDESLQVIQEKIKSKLINDEGISLYLVEELLDEILQSPENWEWSINKDDLTIYFNEYEIAAGAAGDISTNISLKEINPFLKNYILESLDFVREPTKNEIIEQKEKEEEGANLDPNGKYVALTFDDGPSQTVTPRILKILKENEAKATFFMLGSQVDYYPTIAKQVADEGHEVANHTENHVDLTVADVGKIKQEINDANEKIQKATGYWPTAVRPPYGAYDQNVVDVVSNNEHSIIMWSVDSLDWKSRNAAAVNEVILRDIVPGSIVLMHDIHESTADALSKLLSELKQRGYEFITVSQLLSLQDKNGVGPHYGTLNY